MAHALSVLDYIAFIVVLSGSTLIGLYHGWKTRNIKNAEEKAEFMSGGRGVGLIPISISLVASFMSIGSILGIPAEIYTHSVSFSTSCIGGFMAAVLCRTIFLPMFHDLQLPSVNKYLQKRFNFPALRIFTSASFVFMNMLTAGIAIYGPALAISSVSPLPVNLSILAVGFVCTFYTGFGGMKAVVWADVLQFSVMLIGVLLVAVQGTITAGGWDKVWETADRGNLLQWANFHVDSKHGVPMLMECVLGLLAGYGGMFSTNQMSVQRFCSFPEKKTAIRSVYLSMTLMMFFVLISCYCGVAIFANYYDCDPILTKDLFSPDQLMPYYVMQNLSFLPGVAGIFVAAVFSGSLSTISSFINSVTIVVWHDMLKRFVHVSVKTETVILKIIAFSFGFITTGLAFFMKGLGTVMEVATMFFAGVYGPQLGMFLLGVLCPFVDGVSATFGFVAGQLIITSINVAVIVTGRPKRRIPTNMDGCPAVNGTDNFSLMMLNLNETIEEMVQEQTDIGDVYWFHNISPYMLPFLGCLTTVVCGIVATLFTGGMKLDKLDPRYVHSFIRRYLQRNEVKKTKSVEVSLMEKPLNGYVREEEANYT